jgi:hypothetical protein
MPWKVKRLLMLMACGFGLLGLAAAVLTRDHDLNVRLLAVAAILGGVAVLLTNLPGNGDDKH